MSDKHFLECRRQCIDNDPPVEVGQIWIAEDGEQRLLRRIEILGQYPKTTVQDGRIWIFEEKESLMNKHGLRELGTCPEFNLRYVFKCQ